MRGRSRLAFGILAIVCMLGFAAALVVMAHHALWRTSSRNLFSVQEHRQLVNLCRSALAEAVCKVQIQLEQGASSWIDWCTVGPDVNDRTFSPRWTREYTAQMSNDPRFLEYRTGDVTIHRIKGVGLAAGLSAELGAIDFTVTAEVERHSPRHTARLTMTERRAFWFSDTTTPFSRAGRHIEFMPTPVATFRDGE